VPVPVPEEEEEEEEEQLGIAWVVNRRIVRSERPLCRQALPQLFDLGNGFPDLRLRQV
jgi:hypothetical protein